MMAPMSARALVLGLAIIPLVGACDDDACKRVEKVTVVYSGTQQGFAHWRSFAGDTCLGGTRSMLEAKAPPRQIGSLLGCYDDILPATDIPDRRVEAWIDVDGDDPAICATKICDPSCMPEVGEPQGTLSYVLKASGKTEPVLELTDP